MKLWRPLNRYSQRTKETERLSCGEQKVNQDKLAQQHTDIKF